MMKKALLLLAVLGLLLTSAASFAQVRGRQAGRFSRQSADGTRVSPGGGARALRTYGEGRKWSRTQQTRTTVNTLPKVSPRHGAKTRIKEFEKPNLEAPEVSLMPAKISGEVGIKKTAASKDKSAAPAAGASAAKGQENAPVSKTEIAEAQQDQAAALKQAQDMARQMGVELPGDMQQMMSGGAAAPGAMPAGMPDMSKMMGGTMPAGMPDLSKMTQGANK